MTTSISKLIDKTKILLFTTKNSAFLAPILCQLKVEVTKDPEVVKTAMTNGISLVINEDFFRSLDNEGRITLLLHETWHVARLHMLRRDNRDPHLWNIACDIRINNDLAKEGRDIKALNGLLEPTMDHPNIRSEEEIYDILKQVEPTLSEYTSTSDSLGSDDIKESSEGNSNQTISSEEKAKIISNVVKASQLASSINPGAVPGDSKIIIEKFLKPVLPWERLLENFFNDISYDDFSWRKPNRRYSDIYLPSKEGDSKLEHLAFFIDTSGSISEEQLQRFNSEVKFIQETYRPHKLSVIQFDTCIHKEDIYTPDDTYVEIECEGRGGTSLDEVHQYIVEKKPTASIIFTDLYCAMMPEVKSPVFWIISDNKQDAPFGKSIHI